MYLNKEKEQHSGVAFADISNYFPVAFSDPISGAKTLVDWDDEVEQFLLDINGEPFENHPYLDPTFSLDDTQIKVLSAKILINKKLISEGSSEWQPAFLQHAIWHKIEENEPITSISIEDVGETESSTMNELLGLLFMQENIPAGGLDELSFDYWRDLTELLDNSVLEQMVSKCR